MYHNFQTAFFRPYKIRDAPERRWRLHILLDSDASPPFPDPRLRGARSKAFALDDNHSLLHIATLEIVVMYIRLARSYTTE